MAPTSDTATEKSKLPPLHTVCTPANTTLDPPPPVWNENTPSAEGGGVNTTLYKEDTATGYTLHTRPTDSPMEGAMGRDRVSTTAV